jgi:hypothetical protein
MWDFLAVGVFGGSVVKSWVTEAGVRSELNGRWSRRRRNTGSNECIEAKAYERREKGDVKQEGEIGGGVD